MNWAAVGSPSELNPDGTVTAGDPTPFPIAAMTSLCCELSMVPAIVLSGGPDRTIARTFEIRFSLAG